MHCIVLYLFFIFAFFISFIAFKNFYFEKYKNNVCFMYTDICVPLMAFEKRIIWLSVITYIHI